MDCFGGFRRVLVRRSRFCGAARNRLRLALELVEMLTAGYSVLCQEVDEVDMRWKGWEYRHASPVFPSPIMVATLSQAGIFGAVSKMMLRKSLRSDSVVQAEGAMVMEF